MVDSAIPFTVDDGQDDISDYPDVAALADGGFVVAWSDVAGVYTRYYDAAGGPAGAEIAVASFSSSDPPNCQVTVLSDGNVVVLWAREVLDGFWIDDQIVEGAVLSPTGAPLSTFSVSTPGDGVHESLPEIAGLGDGGFVASWYYSVLDADATSDPDDISGESGVRTQLFSSAGVPVGPVHTTPLGEETAVAQLADGGYVLAWAEYSPYYTLYAQAFMADGSPIGSAVTLTTDFWAFDVSGLEGGGYVVTWETSETPSGTYDVWAQVVSDFGADPAFLVNSGTAGQQTDPSVTGTDDGGFVIAWRHSDSTGNALNAQRFTADGERQGAEFQLAANVSADGTALASLTGSGLVAVWDNNNLDDIQGSLLLPSSARLILTATGQDVTVGGGLNVIGTTGPGEVITVTRGNVGLDGSFNVGGDTVVLPGEAGSYTATLTGSYVVIGNGHASVAIPVGIAGLTVQFSDAARTLLYDPEGSKVLLGDQAISTTTAVEPATGASFVPAEMSGPDSSSVLILSETGQDFDIGGNVSIIGTTGGGEVFNVLYGDIRLDGSFNVGGDTVILPGSADSYSANLAGSFVTIAGGDISVAIPVGIAGLSVMFNDTTEILRFDTSTGQVMLGDEVVASSSSAAWVAGDGPDKGSVEQYDSQSLELFSVPADLPGGAEQSWVNEMNYGYSAELHRFAFSENFSFG